MSNKPKKLVQIKENDLVALIENIVNEAVAQKKEQWLSEQVKIKTSKLEETITKIVNKQLGK